MLKQYDQTNTTISNSIQYNRYSYKIIIIKILIVVIKLFWECFIYEGEVCTGKKIYEWLIQSSLILYLLLQGHFLRIT